MCGPARNPRANHRRGESRRALKSCPEPPGRRVEIKTLDRERAGRKSVDGDEDSLSHEILDKKVAEVAGQLDDILHLVRNVALRPVR